MPVLRFAELSNPKDARTVCVRKGRQDRQIDPPVERNGRSESNAWRQRECGVMLVCKLNRPGTRDDEPCAERDVCASTVSPRATCSRCCKRQRTGQSCGVHDTRASRRPERRPACGHQLGGRTPLRPPAEWSTFGTRLNWPSTL